jgi:hypothetical protein
VVSCIWHSLTHSGKAFQLCCSFGVPSHFLPDCLIVRAFTHKFGVAAGADVKKFKVGDFAGIGCMVDSCLSCNNCKRGDEQYCIGSGAVMTYNAKCATHQCLFPYGDCSSHQRFVVFTLWCSLFGVRLKLITLWCSCRMYAVCAVVRINEYQCSVVQISAADDSACDCYSF